MTRLSLGANDVIDIADHDPIETTRADLEEAFMLPPLPKPKMRRCLRCEKKFLSDSPGHRICGRCEEMGAERNRMSIGLYDPQCL